MRLWTLLTVSLLTSVAWSDTGTVDLHATGAGSPILGTAQLTDTPRGLHLKVHLLNATPGLHAFHIHEFGSCADAGKAAGSHYNPLSTQHGQVLKDGVMHAHAGDMGNIQVTSAGVADLELTLPGVTLTGTAHSVAGRALIVHEKVDDFTQPAGNAGGRVACGPILLTGN
jgi:Cu-Zn family superoxide dismutase